MIRPVPYAIKYRLGYYPEQLINKTNCRLIVEDIHSEKNRNMILAPDAVEVLNELVANIIRNSIATATYNKRNIVQSHDL